MKVSIRSSNQGSMLVITVCFAVVIGLGLVSYLLLVNSKNKLVSRSLHWNMAMAHAEAGVEEALAQLNHKFGTNLDRAANGWGGPTAGVFGPRSRNLRTGAYSVTLSTETYPTIISTGYATNPLGGNIATVARTVEVKTAIASVFQVGMAAKLNVTFKGNNVHIDSFDSADPAHDDPLDPTEVKANGDVASTDGFVSVGNANINGKIKTGPGGSYAFGPNGYAGPIGWLGPGLYSPDWYQNDFNADFKDVEPPFDKSAGFSPVQITVNTNPKTNYWLLSEGNWIASGIPNNCNIVVAGGNARLWITGDFKPNNTAEIIITDGSTIKLYVGETTGPDTSAVFANVNVGATGKAATFQYYGLPTNKEVTWSGNDKYKGTVYAPQATFTMGGGGSPSDVFDYQGACVVYEAVLNGHFNFHYDEDLKKKPPVAIYVAGRWREL